MQKLLRTSLFSLFAFVLAAGMAVAPVQAQQSPDIEIDADDGDTILGELGNATAGDVVRIVASNYDENVVINNTNTGLTDGDQLTIQIESDGTDDDVRLGQFGVNDGIEVTLNAVNGGFVNVISGGPTPALQLANGGLDLESSSVLEVFGGAEVRRTAQHSLTGNAPTFNGAVAASFVVNNGSIDETSGLSIIPDDDAEVSVTGSSGNSVTLPSGVTLADLGSGDALNVGAGSAVVLNGGTVNNTVTNDGTLTADAAVTFNGEVTNNGTFTANAGLTFNAALDNSGSGTVDFQSGTSTYSAGNELDNSGTGTVNIASGATLDIDATLSGVSPNDPVLTNGGAGAGVTGAGTLEFSGDSGESFSVESAGANEILADNSGSGGSGAGTITNDRLVTINDDGGASAITLGNITASGNVTLSEGASGSGVGTQTAGTITANSGATVDFFDSSNDATTGSLTATGTIDLSSIGGSVTTGAITTNDGGTVNLDGSGSGGTDAVRIEGAVTVDGSILPSGVNGEAVITGDVSINDGGTFDLTGSSVRFSNASLSQTSGGTFQTDNGTEITLSGDESDELDHNTITTVGALTFDKSNGAVATLGEALRIDDSGGSNGDAQINGTAVFQDNLLLTGSGGSGTLDVQGDLTQENDPQGNPTFIIFSNVNGGSGKTLTGADSPELVENVRVDNGSGNDVTLDNDVVFGDRLELLSGGIAVNGNDLVPDQGAQVVRSLGNGTSVANAGGGSFNGPGNSYDLTYRGGAANVGLELSRDLNNLTVESGATPQLIDQPQLTEDGVVNGVLTVESGAQIADDGSGARTLVLAGSEETHSIEGVVARANGNSVTLRTDGDNTTIEGSTDDANAARIENLVVNASGVAIDSDTPLQQIDGNVTVQEGDGLDLALYDAQGDDTPAEAGTDDDNDGTDDRTIEGRITVNGDLTLASTVETVNENGLSAASPAVAVNDGVTTGTLSFGDNDLVFTGGSGAALLANSDNNSDTTPFSSTGGALVFDNNASNSQQIAASGEAIPRIKIEESNGGRFIVGNGSTNGDFATTVQLDADEEIDLNGNTVEVSGIEGDGVRDVELSDDVTGSGDFRVVGTTVTAQADLGISNFTVATGSGETATLQSDSESSGTPFTVTIGTAFELASGSLAHGDTDLQIDGTFAYTGSGSPETEIEATGGLVDLSNAGLSLALDNALAVSNLKVTENADLGTDDVNLTIGSRLELDDQFDASTSSGSVFMRNDATVQRLAGTSVSAEDNPLTETLAVSGSDQYNIVYGEASTNNYNSDQELVSGQINRLTVNSGGTGGSGDAVFLTDRVASDNVRVEVLELEYGTLDYGGTNGRQLEIADGGEVIRYPDAALADDSNNNTEDSDTNDPAPLAAEGTFALEYEGDGDDTNTGSPFSASALEFTSDVSSLTTKLGDADGNGTNFSVDIGGPLPRTVTSLSVENNTSGSDTNINGNLTVEGNADVTGGNLAGSGSVDLTGESSVFTANGSGVDVRAELSLANALDVENEATVDATVDVDGPTTLSGDGELFGDITSAGDITVDGGSGTLGDNSTSFTFDGSKDDQAVSLNGADAEANTVTMAKSNESPVPQTTVSGGNVILTGSEGSGFLDLDNGVLAVEGDVNAVDLGEGSYERESDPSFDPTQDTSHVAGNIIRTIGETGVGGGVDSGDRIDVTYPVGSDNAAYRPIQFIFDEGNAVDNNDLTAGHTDPAPTPSNNLPLTTETGVTIGTDVPNYYWRAETDENLGIGQDNDFEIAVTTSGLDLVEPLADHRILRQEEDDGAPWSIQGADGQYDNSGTASSVILRNEASTGGLSPEGRRFAVGVPQPPAPTFTDALQSPQTVAEGDTLSGSFAAEVDENSSGSVEFAVDAPSAIEDSVDIGASSGELSYRPGFDDAADSPYDLTIEATDTETGAVADSVISVEVQNTGVPPAFAQIPSDQTVVEGDVVSANFEATTEDPASASDAIEYAVSVAPSTVSDSVTVDETGEVRFATNLDDAADSPYTLTVTATDTDAQTTADASFEVAVNDDVQPPVFVDGSRPSDFTPVARDTSRESTSPTTIDVTAQVEDPSSAADQLGFETDVDWASVTSTSTSGDQATATIALEPGFEEAKSAAESNDSLDVSVTATDGATGEPVSETVSVNVRFNPFLGDADGLGSAYSANDAFAALAIAVGKSEIEQGGETFPLLDGHVRAADVSPPTEGDTLDANTDDVNAFDALRILQGPPEENGGATVAAQASAQGQSAGGAIQIGEVNRKDGMATVPVRLSGSASNVQAADLKVTLTDEASVEDVQASTPGGWISSYNVSDEGVLTVGMAGTNALSGGQKIATVRLDATGNGQPFTEGTYQLNGAGEESFVVETTPSEFALDSNYPNPVQTSTTIEYKLKEARSVTMEVYNTLGQKVATLVDEEKEAGSHSVSWEAGNEIASGVYFYRIEAGDFTETKRITVVR